MAKIKIQAAARLKATRRRRLRAKTAPVIDQDFVDICIPTIFRGTHPVTTMSQREKVDLRLPYPYAEVWRTEILGHILYVSVNAETYQLWCCVFADVRRCAPDVDTTRAFISSINFGVADRKMQDCIMDAFDQTKKRIARWLSSIEKQS